MGRWTGAQQVPHRPFTMQHVVKAVGRFQLCSFTAALYVQPRTAEHLIDNARQVGMRARPRLQRQAQDAGLQGQVRGPLQLLPQCCGAGCAQLLL